jgi:hypothetical protein
LLLFSAEIFSLLLFKFFLQSLFSIELSFFFG